MTLPHDGPATGRSTAGDDSRGDDRVTSDPAADGNAVATPEPLSATKSALRDELRDRRRARTAADRAAAAQGLAHLALTIPELAALVSDAGSPKAAPQDLPGGCVAAYASYGTEPGTTPLRAALAGAGVAVLLPVIGDDGGLDWAWDSGELGSGSVSPAVPEPTGEIVGRGATGLVALHCSVLLAPALGADLAGHRIGKAGGFYDRLLAGLDRHAPARRPLVVAVVHDDDVVDHVPTEPHDRGVDAILTPTRYLDLRRAGSH